MWFGLELFWFVSNSALAGHGPHFDSLYALLVIIVCREETCIKDIALKNITAMVNAVAARTIMDSGSFPGAF